MTDPVIETSDGRLRGTRQADGWTFRGIPYGGSTAGARRFLAPPPTVPWAGVRDATRFGPRAMQVDRPHRRGFEWLDARASMSEDCLVLNVHTPSLPGRRPVMVWLHGGAFAFGSSDASVYEADALAARGDVVVVTLNHRLNVFGYLAPIDADERFADAGNAGVLDLVAALEWVAREIAAFGGDPGCVTLFGQSGGAAKVALLMAVPQAAGLFHRVILQSPSTGFRVQEPEGPARQAHALLQACGCPNFGALQAIPPGTLLQAMGQVIAEARGRDEFRPMIDGRSLLAHPFHPVAPALSQHIPMIVGTTDSEATYYLQDDASRTIDAARLRARVRQFMQLDEAEADRLLRDHAALHPADTPYDRLVRIVSDHAYRLTTVEGAMAKAAQAGAPVFLYRFDWKTPMDALLRSPHTAELPFVFGRIDAAPTFIAGDRDAPALSSQMVRAWTRFARTGDPNGPDVPAWSRLTRHGGPTLCFNAPASVARQAPDGEDLAVMRQFRRFLPGTAFSFWRD